MAGWNKEKVAAYRAAFDDFLKYLEIDSKDSGVGPLKLYNAQKRFLDEVFQGLENDIHWFVVLKARQLGLCYDPSMRVLTHDLRWVPISDVSIGDELVAVDETPITKKRGIARKMRTAVVEAKREVFEHAIKITMDNGVTLIATPQHRHLVKKRGGTETVWKPVSWLRPGDEIRYVTKPWNDAPGLEDAWFSGLSDGEGSMRQKTKAGVEFNVSQVDGDVLRRARKYLIDRGYSYREEIDSREPGMSSKLGTKNVHKLVVSRMDELFRLLGIIRPTRFINNRWWEGKDLPGKKIAIGWAKVMSVELVGQRPMIDLQTSTKTFICEGFVSHNSTITRALQVFWCFMHPGLRLALVYDRDDHKEEARAEIKRFLDGLPETHRLEATKHDRYICEFTNGSRLSYFVAGIKKSASSGGLGRGRGINACGATEVSSWADIEGLRAFQRSLSDLYPDALYIWESTARGLNIFYDLWMEARADDLAKKAIFIGWWAKETYQITKDTPLFERYGVNPPDEYEQEKIDLVKEKYGFEISMEQLAWYRHQVDPNVEAKSSDSANSDDILKQELPFDEDEAFLTTGSAFFPGDKLTEAMKNASRLHPKGYRYVMTDDFFSTTIEPVKLAKHATLKVWEEPHPDGFYAIGCDPAGGSSEEADRFCIQVIRCYADGADQVAEFCQTVMASHQFAWVIAHLCGAYNNARLLMELNGPGYAVLTAFRELELLIRGGYLKQEAIERGMSDILANVRHYIWSGMDSIHQDPTAFHWKTSTKLKLMIMNRMNDFFSLSQLNVRSMDALQEMQKIVREGDSVYGEGQSKDDRVIALALACHAWERSERKRLIAQERTRRNEERRQNMSPQDMYQMFNERVVGNFFAGQKRVRLAAKQAARRGARWNW